MAPLASVVRQPAVSAIIPAYNYAAFLPKAIDSVLQQNYPEFEIIVVDDGSTDNTAAVVADYARRDRRIRYVHQNNAGLAAARNTGIRNARFDFVAFLDSDDEWLPDFLKRGMTAFAELPDDFAIVACPAFYMDGNGVTLDRKRLTPEQPHEIRCRDLIFRNHFVCTVVARKRALVECGFFDETLRSSEDRDMWIRVAARWRVHIGGERLVRIRSHATSMSRHSDRMKANSRRVINKAWSARLIPRSDIFSWLQVLSFFHFQVAWTYRDEGRRIEAVSHMICSLVLWPWFLRPGRFGEPALFRARALLRFVGETFARPRSTASGITTLEGANRRDVKQPI